jgi:hypothetical protein
MAGLRCFFNIQNYCFAVINRNGKWEMMNNKGFLFWVEEYVFLKWFQPYKIEKYSFTCD